MTRAAGTTTTVGGAKFHINKVPLKAAPTKKQPNKTAPGGKRHADLLAIKNARTKAAAYAHAATGAGPGVGESHDPPQPGAPPRQDVKDVEEGALPDGRQGAGAGGAVPAPQEPGSGQGAHKEHGHARTGATDGKPTDRDQEDTGGAAPEAAGRGTGPAVVKEKKAISEERAAQLCTARERAAKVRREKGALRRQEREMKDKLYEQRKRELERMQDEFEAANKRRHLSEAIPDPLPKPKPPAYLSGVPPLPDIVQDIVAADPNEAAPQVAAPPEEHARAGVAIETPVEPEAVERVASKNKKRRLKRVEYYTDSSGESDHETRSPVREDARTSSVPRPRKSVRSRPDPYAGVFGDIDDADEKHLPRTKRTENRSDVRALHEAYRARVNENRRQLLMQAVFG